MLDPALASPPFLRHTRRLRFRSHSVVLNLTSGDRTPSATEHLNLLLPFAPHALCRWGRFLQRSDRPRRLLCHDPHPRTAGEDRHVLGRPRACDPHALAVRDHPNRQHGPRL